MKRIKIGFLVCILNLFACTKVQEVSLPPLTSNGAGNFGCLINGKSYTAHASYSNRTVNEGYIGNAYYQKIQNKYSLGVAAELRSQWLVVLFVDSLNLQNSNTVFLGNGINTGTGAVFWNNRLYKTNDTVNGKLIITYHDPFKSEIAGTFNFNAIDTVTKNKIEVTDGRFDVIYTK